MLIKKYYLYLLTMLLLFSLTACGVFSIGVESPNNITNDNGISQIPEPQNLNDPTENYQEPSSIDNSPTGFPNNVTLGSLGIYGSQETGVLVIEEGQIRIDSSPVDYGAFWGYSPESALLAYSSEFFHGSNPDSLEGIPISDLWVYDYKTKEAEQWLDNNVAFAVWAPDGEHITAAVFDPGTGQLNLAFVNNLGEIEIIAECASINYSWSPKGDALAMVVRSDSYTGINLGCSGTYIVNFPEGLDVTSSKIQRISGLGNDPKVREWPGDRPMWALDQNALIYPGAPMWVIPLDGNKAFTPIAEGRTPSHDLSTTVLNIWSPELRQMIGTNEVGRSSTGGVWVYQLSEDLQRIERYYRLGDKPIVDNSDIDLVAWWEYGKSILVMDGDFNNDNHIPFVNEFWATPFVWSLEDNLWIDIEND